MCIIAIKNKGNKFDEKTVKTCFLHNPDGAGFMYADGGKVHIEKGFFSADSYIERINELWEEKGLQDKNLVMHFRISTSGGISQKTCHPFPISKRLGELRKTEIDCNNGIVHNGVIFKYANEVKMSDTQRFIIEDINRLWKKNNITAMSKEMAGNGRFCILKADGSYELYGDFVEDEIDGEKWVFSNDSYKERIYDKYYYYDYPTDEDYYDEYWEKYSRGWDDSTNNCNDIAKNYPNTYYDDFEEYFKAFWIEASPMSKKKFKERLDEMYILTDDFIELESGMYLSPKGKYAMDYQCTLYRINFKEKRLTNTGEKVSVIV